MKINLLQIFSLFFVMLITGVFWGTWFPLTRTMERFSPAEFIHIGKVITENVVTPMKVIMPLGMVLMLLSLLTHRDKLSTAFYCGVISFILMIIALMITLIVLVPINHQIPTWTSDTIPEDWEEMREKWRRFHTIRTWTSLAGFVLFSWFLIDKPRKRAEQSTQYTRPTS